MEEAALREAMEEAGVRGVLGVRSGSLLFQQLGPTRHDDRLLNPNHGLLKRLHLLSDISSNLVHTVTAMKCSPVSLLSIQLSIQLIVKLF